jgi:tol-pal system protein YbgF
MKFLRLVSLLLACSSFSFAVNKDIVQLQRDLEEKMNALQNDVDSKLSAIDGRLSAMQNDTRRTADQVATMQDAVSNGVAKSLAPVAGMGGRVDAMGDDVRSLKDALADLSGRLERMDAKLTDLKNQLQIIQSPPPAPGVMTTPGSGAPPQAGLTPGSTLGTQPPPGVSADRSYTDAVRDLQTGKTDLARNEFQQYLTYFPNTELAPKAQYYLGEIDYNRGDFTNAVKNFDLVLEHYPENPKTADAHLMKGLALLKSNRRNNAVQEFRVLVSNYPHTDQARKALQQLRSLGVSSATTPSNARR